MKNCVLRVLIIVVGIIFFLVVILTVFVSKAMDDSVDFGQGYKYIQDYPQCIVWENPSFLRAPQDIILEGFVTKVAYDTHFLLLQTRGVDWRQVNADTTYTYWIIEKSTRKISSYKTRMDLEIARNYLGIELELQDFPYYEYSQHHNGCE